MKLKHLLTAFITLLAITSCKKGNKVSPQTSTDIYVAGYVKSSSGSFLATYWKNGTAVDLSHGNSTSQARAIAVSSGDVYAAGSIAAGNDNFVAVVWKNGVETRLADSTITSFINSIAISGNDVYIGGNIGVNPVYWKNGTAVTLPLAGFTFADVNSIKVVGGDVYAAGYVFNRSGYAAAYWKNNTEVTLTDPTKVTATASDIAVMGSDIYVVGTIDGYLNNVATLWKNGVASNITPGTVNSAATAITIRGNDINIIGQAATTLNVDNSIPAYYLLYYKNNISQLPVIPGFQIQGLGAAGVAVSGNDVYVAGSPGGMAGYYKNNTPVQFSNGSGIGITLVTN